MRIRVISRILVAKPEGKILLRGTKSRWINNTKMYLREIG
jgi:hypothetical protein